MRVAHRQSRQVDRCLSGRRSGIALCRRAAAALIATIPLVLGCQNSPTGSDDPPDGTGVDSLTIVVPPRLLVNEVALLRVSVWNGGQRLFEVPVTWASSDPSTVSVESSGETSAVMTAHRRGAVTLTASAGRVVEEVTLRVTADLRIQPDYVLDAPDGWPMAVGDRLQLEAVYTDVNGQPIEETPSLTWTASGGLGVSVSPAGLVTAARPHHQTTVTGTAPDDTVSIQIRVLDVAAGQPATVRIVHGIPGIGAVRFLPSQGAPLSLSYGESAELPILSGTLRVGTEGLPPGDPVFGDPDGEFVGVVPPGVSLSLYAAGNPDMAFLQPAWPPTEISPPGSALVRLVQSSPAMVVYLREQGAPTSGLPELCYFDPGVVSGYFVRPAGGFDVIGLTKYDEQQLGRAAASVGDGQAVTLVLSGGGEQPLSVLTFTDR